MTGDTSPKAARPTMLGRAAKHLKRFKANKRGNTAMIYALTLMPIMTLLGGAIDIMQTNNVRNEVKAAMDASALAAASLAQTGDAEQVVQEYMRANLKSVEKRLENLSIEVTEERSLGARSVKIDVSAVIPTHFLGLLQKSDLELNLSTVAQQVQTNLELSVVMDISSSMRGGRLTNLKTAAESFIDEVMDEQSEQTISINLVPFGGTVNIGTHLFDHYAVPLDRANVDPDEDDYDIGSDVIGGEFRFSNGDSCLEYRNEDFNDSVLERSGHGQVPHFWRWWNFHPWCPDDTSAVMMNSSDKAGLIERIRGLTLSDGTGMNDGAMWGLKALSPDWKGKLGGDFDDRPSAYNDDDTLKALIIMTDGEITAQNRPEDVSLLNVHTNRSQNATSNYGNGRSNQGNRRNMQTIRTNGGIGNPTDFDRAIPQFRRICAAARENGIVVYTIGFQIRRGRTSDRLLAECATDPSKYFFVEGLDIAAAFEGISASLSALRIVE